MSALVVVGVLALLAPMVIMILALHTNLFFGGAAKDDAYFEQR